MNHIEYLDRVRNYVYYSLPPGRSVVKASTLANIFKGSTFLLTLLFMYIWDNFSVQAYVYLSLHGSYGFLWVIKSRVFPDRNFEQSMTLVSAIGGSALLSLYWIIPFNMMSGDVKNDYNRLRIAFCVFVYVIGLFLMIVADCHKYFELKHRGQHLKNTSVKTGLFYTCRNPNYLGEGILYFAFAMLSNNISSYCIIAFVWVTVFAANIICKEASFRRKNDWKEYSLHSWAILPKIIPTSSLASTTIYSLILALAVVFSDYLIVF